ncbi:retinoid-inducible serine carboxypeptidase isoform X1 [Alligator mississippiensis]|uniref:retinoid-inducible serine carboxypeptidase isoform X1 n=1 Tax=Alligator mississippiensis TaxID=8496 RepID=UPI0007115484|nr:retinoid-inducible serine carboxypeptidase isoform X1 [Alligator mississippiensis]
MVSLMLFLSWGAFLSAYFCVQGAILKQSESKEAWGYVQVRNNAHMFWWLYYANNPTKNFTELPLIMWLQGGPGASGCGFGNFEEIGPLNTKLKPRNTTWLQAASILFVDNPVGSGFSYANDSSAFAKDLATVASDMLVLLKEFFKSKAEFQTLPFYIFSESYGGKMTAGIALELHKAIHAGSIKCNFSGAALGDSWISPLDSVLSWGPYLYSTSLLDDKGLTEVTAAAKEVMDAVNKKDYALATQLWSKTEEIIEQNTDGVNFYNILTKQAPTLKEPEHEAIYLMRLYQRHVEHLHKDQLSDLMNGPIRKKLKIIPDSVKWGGQSETVFTNMAGDFMKPVIDIVDQLLVANVNVTIYNGQLDLIVDTMGQEAWVRKLKWPKLEQFSQQKWKALYVRPESTETAAFYKSYENLAFYWILRAGHMVPADQGEMALKMVRMVTQQKP